MNLDHVLVQVEAPALVVVQAVVVLIPVQLEV